MNKIKSTVKYIHVFLLRWTDKTSSTMDIKSPVSVSRSVVSDSLGPIRLLCQWNSTGKIIGGVATPFSGGSF